MALFNLGRDLVPVLRKRCLERAGCLINEPRVLDLGLVPILNRSNLRLIKLTLKLFLRQFHDARTKSK